MPSLPTAPTPSGCTDTCYDPNWKGNGYCDDENNNCGCEWDGGDCCGNENVKQHWGHCLYQSCQCLDPNFKETETTTTTTTPSGCTDTCHDLNWKGDGYCDDENNNCGCEWDGGDCCGKNVDTSYCYQCSCLDPAAPNKFKKCLYPTWKGDGFCDDENNNCGCNWDGGDCCGKDVNTSYCEECACLDPKQKN